MLAAGIQRRCDAIGSASGSRMRYVVYVSLWAGKGFRCCGIKCYVNDLHLKNNVRSHGCAFLGAGRKPNYARYRLPCGHKSETLLANIRKGSFRCTTCTNEKHKAEAEARGCVLLGAGELTPYGVEPTVRRGLSLVKLSSG
jgi:hypothetical protein